MRILSGPKRLCVHIESIPALPLLHAPIDCEHLRFDKGGYPICLWNEDAPSDCAPDNCPYLKFCFYNGTGGCGSIPYHESGVRKSRPRGNGEMPLKIEDLLGAREEMEIISARMAKLEGRDALVVVAKKGDEEFRYGVLPDIVDKVLAAGHKTADGTIVLKLPAPDKSKRINWVTAY